MKVLLIALTVAVAAAAETSYERYNVQEPHSFAYQVQDTLSYVDFAHNHNNDGKYTTGSYRVVLPDGRTQTVHYTSDSVNGYVVEVKYDGQAKYDEYRPSTVYPAYKPTPVVYKTTTPEPVVYTTPRPVVVYTTPRPVVVYTTTEPAVVYNTTPESTYRRMKTYPSWFFNTNKA